MLDGREEEQHLCHLVSEANRKAFIIGRTSCGRLIMLISFPSIPILLAVFFNQEKVLHFVKCFPASIEMIMRFFLPCILLMWFISLIDFHMFMHPYFPGINPTWSWYIILLMC
jgi:hypothetical protein